MNDFELCLDGPLPYYRDTRLPHVPFSAQEEAELDYLVEAWEKAGMLDSRCRCDVLRPEELK